MIHGGIGRIRWGRGGLPSRTQALGCGKEDVGIWGKAVIRALTSGNTAPADTSSTKGITKGTTKGITKSLAPPRAPAGDPPAKRCEALRAGILRDDLTKLSEVSGTLRIKP